MPRASRLARLSLTLSVAALLSGCGAGSITPVAPVGVAGHVNEHVSAASDGASLVALAWAATAESTGTHIYAAVSTDGGTSFSTPVRVTAADRPANVNGEQPPRVVIERTTPDGTSVVVLWTAKEGDGTSLLYARSTDGGRTFGATTPLSGVDAPGNRGWQSMAAASDGRTYALWLDHRDTAQAMAGHAHHHGASEPATMDGVARAQRSQLFVGSLDGTLAPKAIARGVCYCCKTAVTAGADGRLYAAWRHVYPGNMRDIAFTMSRDGGRSFSEPVRVSEDDWQLDGCPENGPALALDASKRIHLLWPTLVRDEGVETLRLFHAVSADGRAFGARTPLAVAGAAYHPQLVATQSGALVAAWDEVRSGQRRVKASVGRVDDSGAVQFSDVALGDDTTGAYPALTATRTHAVLAWARRGAAESRLAVRLIPLSAF